MSAVPRCSEYPCPNKLVYEDGSPKPAGTLTCSVACRSKRARRMKREAKKRGGDMREAHVQEISDALKSGDALHEAAVEEFRPIVREAMTESVLRDIDSLIGMSPKVIKRLEKDLDSQDETIAQRAYTLWFKYTMGNPSVAPPSQQAQPGGLTVQFNIPRPGDDPTAVIDVAADAETLKTCDDCHTAQPESSFVAGSSRCEGCFNGMGSMLAERFGDAYKS